MAYQNVGTPRFYVSWGDFYKQLGYNVGSILTLNPTQPMHQEKGDAGTYYEIFNDPNRAFIPANSAKGANFAFCLGHNLGIKNGLPDGLKFICKRIWYYNNGNNNEQEYLMSMGDTNSINYNTTTEGAIEDGFSAVIGDADGWSKDMQLSSFSGATQGSLNEEIHIGFSNGTGTNWTNDVTAGFSCMVFGKYYDMPHSPDLSLTLSYEMDGIKTQQTKGGSTLSNAMYTKAPNWGDYGAWQLGDVSSFRTGRRIWNLSFSYLSDTDVFPVNANTSYNATIGSETGYGDNAPSSDTDGNYVFDSNILTGTDFFSQVWNRTMGGHLPFIFNPNGGGTSPNNNPDQFAIARFDMDSLQYDQVAHNTYNVKLKIREVW